MSEAVAGLDRRSARIIEAWPRCVMVVLGARVLRCWRIQVVCDLVMVMKCVFCSVVGGGGYEMGRPGFVGWWWLVIQIVVDKGI